MNIEELLKDLDKDLIVTETKKIEKTIYITCEISKNESECPFCNHSSNAIHSKYMRTISDLPIQNKEVKLLLVTRKFFCSNPECNFCHGVSPFYAPGCARQRGVTPRGVLRPRRAGATAA